MRPDRRPWFPRVLAVIALSTLLLSACGDDDDDDAGADDVASDDGGAYGDDGGGSEAAEEAEPGEVRIEDTAFNPEDTTVAVGDTVTWENHDGFAHTVTADDDSFATEEDLAEGDTFEHTFDTAGEFAYHCEIHNSMQGTITVE